MKKIFYFFVFLMSFGFLSCGTTSGNFTGDGGKGKSLTILAPKATGLLENQLYLPTLIQGEFVSNILNYSSISVLDRERLDEQYAELLSGYYSDYSEEINDLGHLIPTDYIMGGSITKTSTGYALQISITKSKDKMTVASYSGNCTFEELDNLIGIRRVSLDLLEKLGVTTTEKAKKELTGGASTNYVGAQTSLARGIVAQRNGNIGLSLSYFYNAISFEPNLTEARNRVSNISRNVSTGNIGENARNAITYRNVWKKILDECDAFFIKHLPFAIYYNSRITQSGNINYRGESINLSMEIEVKPTEMFKMIGDVQKGLNQTRKKEEWGFETWPFITGFEPAGEQSQNVGGNMLQNAAGVPGIISTTVIPFGKNMKLDIVLINDNGEIISSSSVNIFGQAGTMTSQHRYSGFNYVTSKISIKPISKKFPVYFRNVDVNKITDNTVIKIVRINGIEADTAGVNGYIKIINRN